MDSCKGNNLLDRSVVLHQNAKIAQVHPCLAFKELKLTQHMNCESRKVLQNVVHVHEPNKEDKMLQTDYAAEL